LALLATPAAAQDRVVELYFTPTGRAQIAVWIETAAGDFVETMALTTSVAYRGIGNRPGATLMNSGFRWPYGRRESVLPVWAHRRAAAPGAERFPRVIFQDRTSEGFASRTSNDASRDDYFCLSFNADTTRREALDAVSCASVFNSDKGRYLTEADVSRGYSEPWEEPDGSSFMRPLELGSLYPPRRDLTRCDMLGCADHEDVARFTTDARRVMPNIDAVTMATPAADAQVWLPFDVPSDWPAGEYVAFIELAVEGDYNDAFNDEVYPTPTGPAGTWDYWAENYGYAYRGQPSVVYSAPFSLAGPGTYTTISPDGYGPLDGATGEMNPMSAVITDDPGSAPGSGTDRLRIQNDGSRFRVHVIATNVCGGPEPPPECGAECSPSVPCAEGFLCGPDQSCVGFCDLEMPPGAISDLRVETHEDIKHSHEWVTLSFAAPETTRDIARYEVRVSSSPIIDERTFMEALQANAPTIDTIGLVVPTAAAPGETVEVDVGGLSPELRYWVGVRAVDVCNDPGEISVGEVSTTEIHFTTVSPCFVATAAFGTPLATEIGTLRRLRDRHLMTSRAGRAIVDAYYAVGPTAAAVIQDDERLRAAARTVLAPIVAVARWME
jgi:hypothetical protein